MFKGGYAAALEDVEAALSESLPENARMGAYYYEFNRTGVGLVDAILSAVAIAGKGAHHTWDWSLMLLTLWSLYRPQHNRQQTELGV